ncbi:hypothetical protein G6L74_06010 [Agrobacterium tumefaciens]|uniref:recombinase RecT n=1 Tax=Agrobacterium tumefaciens TaxID=358 RepID=UPI00157461ED|nr:hypothetical protein [Agrobacterium tumefaciens]
MNQVVKTEEARQISPSQQFRTDLEKMSDQFAAALPSHIKPEKFQRVVMTAVLSDPDVLKADRKSLMESAIRAAQDGLLPDKREGAFVVFNTKVKIDGRDHWVKAVQWMPMVGGIIKRIHQSGEIKMLTARVVYGGDHFRTWIDDTGEHIEYEPSQDQDTNIVLRVFAMATTVDGAVYVEPLSSKDVEKIRNVSKQKDRGPWSDWWEEMAKKSAIRRLAKRLPLSVDLHDLIQRDNGMFDLNQEAPRDITPKASLSARLAQSNSGTQQAADAREGFDAALAHSETPDALTGEILNNTPSDDTPSTASSSADAGNTPVDEAGADDTPASDAPASTISRDQKWLLNISRMLWAATAPGGDLQVFKVQRLAAMDEFPKPENCDPKISEKANTVSNHCREVINLSLEQEDGLAMIAGLVGVDQDEILRQAGAA